MRAAPLSAVDHVENRSPGMHPGRIRPLRDAVAGFTVVLTVSALGLGVTYYFARRAQIEAVHGELLQIARIAATLVDGDAHRQLVSPDQEGGPEYRRLLRPLLQLQRASEDVFYVYTAVHKDGRLHYVLDTASEFKMPGDTEPSVHVMEEYTGSDDVFRHAAATGTTAINPGLVEKPGLTLLSAFSPIYDSRGQVAGVVGIDMWVRAFNARLTRLASIASAALLGLVMIAGGVGVGVFRLRTAAAVAEARDRQAAADLAAARDAAEQSSRAKSAFLAMMSHELRTPLNAVIGYGELIREDLVARGDAPMAGDVGRILTASRHLTAIIGDILDYSKLEAGRVTLASAPLDPAAMLLELVELMRPGATARGVALVLDARAGVAPFTGDALRLRQVLLNLLGNAVKFTERGAVTVRLRQNSCGPRRVIVTVHDTGTGIAADSLARLFQPFSQVDSSSTRAAGGTGLGLAISRRLVEIMRGTLRVKSRVGRGSTFRVSLPVQAA